MNEHTQSEQSNSGHYVHNKAWRKRNPTTRHRGKAMNYRRGEFNGGVRKEWTAREEELVLTHDGTDRELAQLLGRSVRGIQLKRHRLRSRP